MQDKLVVYVDHPNTGVHMNWTHVNLNKDDLTDKASEIVTGVWCWTPEDMDVNEDKIEVFLLDPELWKETGHRIKWPDVSNASQDVQDAVTRCKINVYKTMKMHWSNERAMAYMHKSEAHREEILTMTGGNVT